MTEGKTLLKDPFFVSIVKGLAGHLDPGVFERCMGDLLRTDFPGLVPVPGGSDSGWDGAIPQKDGEPFALVCTTEKDVIGNLTKSLNSLSRNPSSPRKVVVATSRALTQERRAKLFERARENGFTLIQVVEQQGIADRLYHASHWCKELLGLSGRPSALSVVPSTRRPLISLKPVGRDEDIAWLETTTGDRVLSGEPGSGKTFLFYHLIHERGWAALFLIDTDPGAIANALRDQRPGIVVVDDAHVDPQLLTSLVRLRHEMYDFSIVAGTWMGGQDEVTEALGGLSGQQIRKLELLTRAEILKVILQVGVQEPDEILDDLVDQAANKPGLAVTIATLWLQGLWQQVLEGSILRRNLLGAFNGLVGEKATVVLGAFSLGGDRGMGVEEVRGWIGVDRAEFHQLTSGLAVGGVLAPAEMGVLVVWPPQLRWALIRSVFFPEDGAGLSYRQLLDLAHNRTSAIEALVAAKDRGATIPGQELRELIQAAGSQQSWERAAALSPEFAQWVLDHYPGELCDIARAALKMHPTVTIPRLLERAASGSRPNIWIMQPMSILSEWSQRFGITDEILDRRRLLGRAAKQFLLAGRESSVGIHGLCIALSPSLEETTLDPGGLGINSSVGRIPADGFSGIAGLWTEVQGAIHEIDGEGWVHLNHMLWEWMPPKEAGPHSTEDEKRVMREFAVTMLRELAKVAQQSPGLSAGFKELAGRFGVELSLETDPTFEILYPGEAPKLEEFSTWEAAREAAARSLGLEWVRRDPGEVARELVRYEAEALKIGRRWSLAPTMCEEIAVAAEDPEAWAFAFLAEKTTAEVLRVFLLNATTHKESLMALCIGLEPYRRLATELVLREEVPPHDLLAQALQQTEGLPQIVQALCMRGQVAVQTLVKILHHPHWETALAAAVGEWCALPRGVVREEIHTDWQAALARAQTEDHAATPRNRSLQYWLGVIFAEDPELALDWLEQQLLEKRLRRVSTEEPAGKAVAALDRRQKLQVLKTLDGTAPYRLVPLLVGKDIQIYSALLTLESLQPFHMEPLKRVPDQSWMELALLALKAGYEAEVLVEAAFGGILVFNGAGVEHWSRWVQAFDALERDPRPEARLIARQGRNSAEKRVVAARAAERQMAVNGFRSLTRLPNL